MIAKKYFGEISPPSNGSKWFPSQIRSDNIVHPEFSAFYVDFSCRGGGIGGVGWCGLYKTEETIIDSSKGFNACLSLSLFTGGVH